MAFRFSHTTTAGRGPRNLHQAGGGLFRHLALALLALLSLAGCTTFSGGVERGGSLSDAARQCLVFFDELDRVVAVEGVSDGGERRLAGLPYLRVDRFTASFGAQAVTDDARYRAWVERMRSLDQEARGYEIANLPTQAFPVLRTLGREDVVARSHSCGRLLVEEHAMRQPQRRRLPTLAVVPDDYSTVKRVLGLYSLTGLPFAASERAWQRRTREEFAEQRGAPAQDDVTFRRYAPSERPIQADVAIAGARRLIAAAGVDALGIPRLDDAAREQLLDAFAPSYKIGTGAEYDRFGPLQWIDLDGLVVPDADRYWLDVDPSQSVVYRRVAFTRFGEAVLTQLVYSIWFSERPLQASGDLLGGRLDGLVWRVTLDEQGRPMMFDTIQPSGRFEMFFPTALLRPKPSPQDDPLIEWAFTPIDQPIEQWIGPVAGLAGVSLHIASQTHQLVGVGLPGEKWGEPISNRSIYRTLPEDRLRELPLPGNGTGGGSRSVFGPDGVVPNTERAARFFFWPLGIANPGAMRQWGRQPTAFIGRRHFDDADLLEKRFERVK